MKSLMRYTIKSGRAVEVRDCLVETSLDPTSKKPRPRGKRRGKQLAAQIERNFREAVKRLARILNCNFKGGDLLLTLRYSDERLPESKTEAKRQVRNFLRRLSRRYRKATGRKLRWVLVTADRSSKTGARVRLHHHIVMDPVDWELIAEMWPDDQFSFRRLDNSGDYTAIAQYMIKNTGYERGKRSWSTCQGLEEPEFSQPVPVKMLGGARLPKDARIMERKITENEESGFRAAYIRYVLPEEEKAGKGGNIGHERRTGTGARTRTRALQGGATGSGTIDGAVEGGQAT